MKQSIIYRYQAMHMGIPVIMEDISSEDAVIDVKYRGTGWLLDLATWFYYMLAEDGEPFRFDHVKLLKKPITRSYRVSE